MTRVGSVLLPTAAALAIQHLATQPASPDIKMIFSDGSKIHANTPEASMAFGVVHSTTDATLSVQGHTD
ncbi:hypothetical protein BG006_003686, partial [Podila minutissima]